MREKPKDCKIKIPRPDIRFLRIFFSGGRREGKEGPSGGQWKKGIFQKKEEEKRITS